MCRGTAGAQLGPWDDLTAVNNVARGQGPAEAIGGEFWFVKEDALHGNRSSLVTISTPGVMVECMSPCGRALQESLQDMSVSQRRSGGHRAAQSPVCYSSGVTGRVVPFLQLWVVELQLLDLVRGLLGPLQPLC